MPIDKDHLCRDYLDTHGITDQAAAIIYLADAVFLQLQEIKDELQAIKQVLQQDTSIDVSLKRPSENGAEIAV